MSSYDVTGYTHSDGYALCETCAEYGTMKDEGNESGFVQPIFEDNEQDSDLICDGCGEIVAEKNLFYSPEELLTPGELLTYNQEIGGIYALDTVDGWMCIECFLKDNPHREDFYQHVGMGNEVIDFEGITGAWTEFSLSFESFPDDAPSLECSECGEMLWDNEKGEDEE